MGSTNTEQDTAMNMLALSVRIMGYMQLKTILANLSRKGVSRRPQSSSYNYREEFKKPSWENRQESIETGQQKHIDEVMLQN